MSRSGSHVAIVGAGSVGTTIAYATLMRGLASHVSIHDIDGARVEAEVLDLSHGSEFVPVATIDGSDRVEVCRDADLIVVTAGAKQKPGQTRLDLAARNEAMCRTLVPALVEVAPNSVIVMVTNPVDIVTTVAIEAGGLPGGRVFGSGTVLDSSRFRHLLAGRCGVAVQNVHAYIVGEHGDSEFPLWSSASIGGIALDEWIGPHGQSLTADDKESIAEEVLSSAQRIIVGKGATNWAIGLATVRIVEAVLRDEHRVLPITAPLRGFADFDTDICLSVPRVVSRAGVSSPLPTPIDESERTALERSVDAVSEVLASLG